MKQFIIFISLFLFISLSSSSKNIFTNPPKSSLSGFVFDAKTKQPLHGAVVYISDLKLGVITDSLGKYIIKNLPTGSFLVEVKFEGYKTIAQTIAIKDLETKQDFFLQESVTEVSEVVVTGSSRASQIRENPVPIVSISHDYLVTNISTNAIDAISKIPGVRAVTTGPNVSKPFIRGLGYNRILTLYDGIRQEGQQWGDEHGIEVDQYNVNRVEVIKGAASLSYGSDALAGVVNLIPTQFAPEGKIIGDITTDYQSNNKMFGGSAMLSGTKNGIEWLGRISHKQATNYQNKIDGRVFGTAFNETDANASIGIHRKWGYSHLDFILFDDKQEIPDGSRDSTTWKFTRQITEADATRQIVSDADLNTYKIEPLHQRVQHYRIFSANNFIFNNGSRLLINMGFQQSVRREYSHPQMPTIAGLYLQLSSFNYDIKYSLKDAKGWDVTFGINGMYQQNTVTNGTEFIIPSYHQFDFGPFITAKKAFGKLDIAGGIRYDIRSFNNDKLYTKPNAVTGFDMPVSGADTLGASKPFSNYSHTFSGASGSIGATYNFSEKLAVKANISRGFRAPNIAEISANGVHPGTNFYQIGNADFKPEFSLQEDLGIVYSTKYAVIELNLFNNFINNYIYNQKLIGANGSDSVVAGSGVNQTFKFQASRANLYGGELSIDLHPSKSIHFENSLSVVYATNKGVEGGKALADTEKYLPFIPPLHGTSELRYDFDIKHLNIKHAFVKLQMEYYANQDRIYSAFGTETRTPGYTLFNAGVGGNIADKKGKTICSIYVMANNIFDVAYADHLSRLKYFTSYPNDPREHGIYNMGRNISFKLNVPLNWKMK